MLRTTLVLTIAATTALGGCASLNGSPSPGRAVLPIYDADQTSILGESQRSLEHGHDRSHWETDTIGLPIHVVEHQEHYDWTVYYPENEAAEAVANVALGFAGIPMTAVKAFWQPPWTVERSPDRQYWRLPKDSTGDLTRWHVVNP
jgi:hypothetical protein